MTDARGKVRKNYRPTPSKLDVAQRVLFQHSAVAAELAVLILVRLVQAGARSPGGFTLVTADDAGFSLIRAVEPHFQFTAPWLG